MAKAPAFQLYVNDALHDTRVLSLEAKGAWWDCLLMMWNAPDRGVLAYTADQFARLFGTDLGTAERVISEIESTGVADVVRSSVTRCNADVTLITITNRRMAKEAESRMKTRIRVQKHRCNANVTEAVTPKKPPCNANVTPPSSSSSSSSSSKVGEEEERVSAHQPSSPPPPPPPPTDLESAVAEVLAAAGIRTPVTSLTPTQHQAFASIPAIRQPDDRAAICRHLPQHLARRKSTRGYTTNFLLEDLPNLLDEALAATAPSVNGHSKTDADWHDWDDEP